MSEENVEIVRRLIHAANERDPDAFVAHLHPDVEWVETGDVLPGLRGTYRGRAEVREWFREAFLEAWDDTDHQIEVEEATEGRDGAVLMELHLSAVGRTSGVKTELRVWNVAWFQGDRIGRRRVFWTREEALEAVGLSE